MQPICPADEHYQRGMKSFNQGKPAEAESALRAALAARPEPGPGIAAAVFRGP